MSFKAVIVEQISTNETVVSVKELEDHRLSDGNVTVKIEYTTINYKDGELEKDTGVGLRSRPRSMPIGWFPFQMA